MNKYCENCKLIFDSKDKCLLCGNKKIRVPQENDMVYLTGKDYYFSGMLEDVLKENNIPYFKKGNYGAAMVLRAGVSNIETYDFFVPFGAYGAAKEILEEFFTKEENYEQKNRKTSLKVKSKKLKILSIFLYILGSIIIGLGIYYIIIQNDNWKMILSALFFAPGLLCLLLPMYFPMLIEWQEKNKEKYCNEEYCEEDYLKEDEEIDN